MTIIRRDLTRPSTTIQAAGISGALATILIGVCSRAGFPLQPEEAAAVATLMCYVGGYLVRERVLGQVSEPDEHEAGGP